MAYYLPFGSYQTILFKSDGRKVSFKSKRIKVKMTNTKIAGMNAIILTYSQLVLSLTVDPIVHTAIIIAGRTSGTDRKIVATHIS